MIGLRAAEEGLGGIESAVRALAPRLAGRGVRVTLFCRRRYAGESHALGPGVQQVRLPSPPFRGLETFAYTAAATPLAMLGRFDIIHFHAMGPAAFSALPWLAGVPAVATLHGLDWAREKWGPVARAALRAGEKAALTFPSRTIVVSRELWARCETLRPGQALHIPNGVDADGGAAVPPPLPVQPGGYFLALGRRVPEKGLLTLIEAFRRLATHRRLVLAGPSGGMPRLDRAIEAAAAQDPRVVVTGAVLGPQKRWLLRNAFAFLLPSAVEGHPLSLLEAMAEARPSVVSDIPVLREMAGDGVLPSGLVVPVGSPEDLARAMASLEADPEEARRMGERARERVLREFAWERVADETLSVYRGVLGLGGDRGSSGPPPPSTGREGSADHSQNDPS